MVRAFFPALEGGRAAGEDLFCRNGTLVCAPGVRPACIASILLGKFRTHCITCLRCLLRSCVLGHLAHLRPTCTPRTYGFRRISVCFFVASACTCARRSPARLATVGHLIAPRSSHVPPVAALAIPSSPYRRKGATGSTKIEHASRRSTGPLWHRSRRNPGASGVRTEGSLHRAGVRFLATPELLTF